MEMARFLIYIACIYVYICMEAYIFIFVLLWTRMEFLYWEVHFECHKSFQYIFTIIVFL